MIRPVPANVADSVDLAVSGPAEQERCERLSSQRLAGGSCRLGRHIGAIKGKAAGVPYITMDARRRSSPRIRTGSLPLGRTAASIRVRIGSSTGAQNVLAIGNSTRFNPKLREFSNYNENLSIARVFRISERFSAELRGERLPRGSACVCACPNFQHVGLTGRPHTRGAKVTCSIR